jgi:hypothetical protein
MKRVFYFKYSSVTYVKQEIKPIANSKAVMVVEDYVYCYLRGSAVALTLSKSKICLEDKNLLEKEGFYDTFGMNYKRITRRTFINALKRALEQTNTYIQSL